MENLLTLLLISPVPFAACDTSLKYLTKPDRCHVAPELLYTQCCIFPSFFTIDTTKGCGAMFEVLPFNSKSNSSGFRIMAYDGCKYWKCLLKTLDILGPDDNVDIVRYFAYLDKWVESNSNFSNIMSDAKLFCKQLNSLKLPLKACEFHHLNRCIRNYIDVHCPIILPTELCQDQRDFYKECAEYYL